eukprot:g44971.t1
MWRVAKKHNLTVNLTTFRVWCYACEKEVFLEQRSIAPSPALSSRSTEQGSGLSLGSIPFKTVPIAVADEGESESEEDELKPRGLTGMKNIGNSCYMNAALQALSNCPSYVVPTSLAHGIKLINPMFRGYAQQ